MTGRQRRQIARELAARLLSPDELIAELLEDRRTLVQYNAWLEQENTRLRARLSTRRRQVAS